MPSPACKLLAAGACLGLAAAAHPNEAHAAVRNAPMVATRSAVVGRPVQLRAHRPPPLGASATGRASGMSEDDPVPVLTTARFSTVSLALLSAATAALATTLRPRARSWTLLQVEDVEEGPDARPGPQAAFSKIGQEKEMDSQFRVIRLLAYFVVGFICGLGTLAYGVQLISRLAQPDPAAPVSDALADVGVNGLGLVLAIILYRVDKVPEQKTLVRSEEGGALATLRIRRGGDQVMVGSLRQQKGGKKGNVVVLMAGNPLALQAHFQYLQPHAAKLQAADLMLVPIALPMTRAATIDHTLAYRALEKNLFTGPHIAVPNGGDWVSIFGTECDKALGAGVLPVENGFALVLERNGRVGRRIPGLPSVEELLTAEEGA